MKNIKSHFVFTKEQRSGIFILLLLIVVLQCVYFFFDFGKEQINQKDEELIITFQKEIDSLALLKQNRKNEIKPFNPNFISDYKGYVLGMTVEEIDRLHHFRKRNKYVNSAKEFQEVTKVSDSLLNNISSYFKFPEWTQQKKKKRKSVTSYEKELNKATAQDIRKAVLLDYKLASRIVNFRTKLNGFLSFDQLNDVYGLSSEEASLIKQKFELKIIPQIQKININLADVSELSSLIYIDYSLATNIVEERRLRDGFKSLNDLRFVENFPVEKLDRIKLYLALN